MKPIGKCRAPNVSVPTGNITRRSLIASLAALIVTFGLILPTGASAQSDPSPLGMTVRQSRQL